MLRIALGVIAGFIAWVIVWLGSEKGLSAIWPAFGVHQRAFEAAIKNGGEFTSDSIMLVTHIIVGSVVSVMAGSLAALIAGENTRASVFIGIVLLAMGLLKAVMSWRHVPLWYHIVFTAMLLPMAILGGKLINHT